MVYSINEAKDFVIRAGKLLAESGLIARTWGNISARISEEQFVITPSGLAYETLTREQIVTVNIADCSYDGEIKPSSEKGIHADAYRLRPEVNFIIHTHQEKASVISIEGKNLNISYNEDKKVLGEVVPCAAYGMPSTGKLRKAVEAAIRNNPGSKAVLMKYHGALCMGSNLEHSFEIAQVLEKTAIERYRQICKEEKKKIQIPDYGSSYRSGNKFILKYHGTTIEYKLGSIPNGAPEEVKLHARIYEACKVTNIIHSTEEEIIRVSSTGRRLRPYLDDLAQIAGVNIEQVKNSQDIARTASRKLKHKNAVLLEGAGALCTGMNENDAKAVGMVLKKGCAADLYSTALNKANYLSTADAFIQRIIYVTKYSKQK